MNVRDSGMVVALGFALVAASLADGELLHGYGVGPSAVLLHVGLLYLLVGTAAVSVRGRGTLLAAVGAHAAFFVVACGLMYYDLVVAPPTYGAVPTTLGVAANRSALALALLPVTAGYLAGGLDSAEHLRSASVLVGAGFVGPAFGCAVYLARGSAPGFTQVLFAGLGVGAVVAGVPLYLLARGGQ